MSSKPVMDHLNDLKTHMFVEEHSITNITSGHPDERKVLDVDYFKKNFKINILHLDDNSISFELIHVDASFANGLRRVLLAEVQTMAFDYFQIENNTSVMQDENLAHRIAMCPVKVDPKLFVERKEDTELSGSDSLKFTLNVKCGTGPKGEIIRRDVTTDDLKWEPIGNQSSMFATGEGPELVKFSSPIVLTKLLSGQEIDLVAYCTKSCGSDHGKFQPVSTAWYTPKPVVTLLQEVTGEAAHRLQSCFSPGVIDIVNRNGVDVARVGKGICDNVSRNVFQHKDLKDAVRMTMLKDHFIFKVESTGNISPVDLVREAIRILIGKSQRLRQELNSFKEDSQK